MSKYAGKRTCRKISGVLMMGLLVLGMTCLFADTSCADEVLSLGWEGRLLINKDVNFTVYSDQVETYSLMIYDPQGEVVKSISNRNVLYEYEGENDENDSFWFFTSDPGQYRAVYYGYTYSGDYVRGEILLTFTSLGKQSTAPTISGDNSLQLNKNYTVSWTSVPNADYYKVYLHAGTYWRWWRVNANTLNKTFTPDNLTEYGPHLSYTVEVISYREGYQTISAKKTVNASYTVHSNVTLTASATSAKIHEEVEISVNAPGAEMVSITCDQYGEVYFDGDFAVDRYWPEWAGTYNFIGRARYNGQWSAISSKVAVKVTRNGALNPPVILCDEQIYNDDNDASFTILPLEGAEGYRIYVTDIDDEETIQEIYPDEAGEFPLDVRIMEEGVYSIGVLAFGADGWENAYSEKYFFCLGKREEGPSISSNPPWECNYEDDVAFTLSCKGANLFLARTKRYAKEYDDEGYESYYPWYDGNEEDGWRELEAVDGKATYIVSAYPADGEIEVEAKARINNGEWTDVSFAWIDIRNTVETEVPTLSAPNEIAIGNPLPLTIEPATEQHHYFGIYVYDQNGNEVYSGYPEGETIEVSIPEGCFDEAGRYTIHVYAKVKGYFETQNPVTKSVIVRGKRIAGPAVEAPNGTTFGRPDYARFTVNMASADLYQWEISSERNGKWESAESTEPDPEKPEESKEYGIFFVENGTITGVRLRARARVAGVWTAYGAWTTVTVDPNRSDNLLKLPAGLKTIEENAFKGIAAKRVIVPASVESIEGGAFANCDSLDFVLIRGRNTQIHSEAFKNCSHLLIACWEGSMAEQFAIDQNMDYNYLD